MLPIFRELEESIGEEVSATIFLTVNIWDPLIAQTIVEDFVSGDSMVPDSIAVDCFAGIIIAEDSFIRDSKKIFSF